MIEHQFERFASQPPLDLHSMLPPLAAVLVAQQMQTRLPNSVDVLDYDLSANQLHESIDHYHTDVLLGSLRENNVAESEITRYESVLPRLHGQTMDYIDYYESVEDSLERERQMGIDVAMFKGIPTYSALMSRLRGHLAHSESSERYVEASRRTVAYLGYLGVNLGMDIPNLE